MVAPIRRAYKNRPRIADEFWSLGLDAPVTTAPAGFAGWAEGACPLPALETAFAIVYSSPSSNFVEAP